MPTPNAHRTRMSTRCGTLGLLILAAIVTSPCSSGAPTTTADAPDLVLAQCLPGRDGYLRARVRGALTLDLAYADRDLECDGEARPDGSGIRLSFAGPSRRDGRRVRLVLGVGGAREGRSGRELPTNLTLMVEGAHKLFSTRGDGQCSIDQLTQEPLRQTSAAVRPYRVVGRGFCLAPAGSLNGAEHVLVSEFDFAGVVRYGEVERPGLQKPPMPRRPPTPLKPRENPAT